MNTDVLSLAVSGSDIFAGTDDGVFLSTDNGTNWTQVEMGLRYIQALAISNGAGGTDLFAGTNGGGVFL